MPEFEIDDLEVMRELLRVEGERNAERALQRRMEVEAAVNIPNPAAPLPQGGLRFRAARLQRPAEPHWDVAFVGAGNDPFPLPVGQARAENGPELWDKILYAVKEIYDPAYVCIAGGAVRDFTLKEQAKDIDVFIHLRDDKFDVKEFMAKAEELGWKNIAKAGKVDPYLKDNKRGLTQAVCRGIVNGWVVDLIVTKAKTGKEVVKGFDFHICHHWYDGQSHATKAATFDVKKRQWTPSRALTKETKEHFERVNKRLGGKYKLNTGEPWYMKFQGKEKLK